MKGILIGEDGDLVISNGSAAIGDVDEQITEFVVIAVAGEIKEIPTIGANVRMMLSGNVDPMFAGDLKSQLKTQHLNTKKIIVNETEISIEL